MALIASQATAIRSAHLIDLLWHKVPHLPQPCTPPTLYTATTAPKQEYSNLQMYPSIDTHSQSTPWATSTKPKL
jgi:hypothetical protein